MNFPPSAYLIGAQKAGTTTLANLLNQHPDICVSSPKEPHFFTSNFNKGLKWYKSKFKDENAKVLLDASVSYTVGEPRDAHLEKSVPEKIYNLNPNAKFIYILRDPVERTFSGYLHSKRHGRINKDFSDLIRSKDFHHISTSDYYKQINHFLQFFPSSSILILLFEDLVENPKKTSKDCFSFLELNENVELNIGSSKNKTYNTTWVGAKLKGLRRKYNFNGLNFIPTSIRENLKRKFIMSSKPNETMTTDDRKYLKGLFEKNNQKLKNNFEVNIHKWQ